MLAAAQIKYINASDQNFTNDKVYDVIGWGDNNYAQVLDDNNVIRTSGALPGSTDWELVSVHVLRPVQLFP